MGAEADDFYLRYAIRRLSAFRNVWWSIANEYDLVRSNERWTDSFALPKLKTLTPIFARSPQPCHLRPLEAVCTHASLQSLRLEKSRIAARRGINQSSTMRFSMRATSIAAGQSFRER